MNLLETIVIGFVAFNVVYFTLRFIKEQRELPRYRPASSTKRKNQRKWHKPGLNSSFSVYNSFPNGSRTHFIDR
ncbi:hypothetical protein [Paludifilum halophilum]|uniref:Uncharacterized protein n=1 Tax=Paludifilum halophilum TaxID=1642702 RepID=A0A235B2Q0_9BACL|nr:hypothetical protein [Paludifilum halophilum]OYD06239.1 hypothetical protein CHM34_17415 [Paludifilum halophilum]